MTAAYTDAKQYDMRNWINQILSLLHLPPLDYIVRQRELGRRISEAEARIRRVKLEKDALTAGRFEFDISQPAAVPVVIPGTFTPTDLPDDPPTLVERRRSRHTERMDAAEILAMRAEARLRAGKVSAARANLGAMAELASGTADDNAINRLVNAVSAQLPGDMPGKR